MLLLQTLSPLSLNWLWYVLMSHLAIHTTQITRNNTDHFISSSPTMLQQNFCREMAQSLGRKPTLQGGGVDDCFLFHYGDVLLKRNLVAQDEDNFRKGIVMCVFPQWPVCTVLFWNLNRNILPLLAELAFANYTLTDPSLQQHDWANENMMQKNANGLVPKD